MLKLFFFQLLLLSQFSHADSVTFDDLKKRANIIQSRVESQLIDAHGGGKPKHDPKSRTGLYLAISESIPRARLEVILDKTGAIASALDMPINVVVRGIDKSDKDIIQYLKRNSWMLDYFDDQSLVGFSIDPIPFQKAEIHKVPAAIVIDDEGVKKSLGFLSFRKMLNNEKVIDSPDLSSISETDMIELMKSKIDPVALEKQARKNASTYWDRYDFPTLVTGKRSRVSVFDPEVEVVSDIVDPNGVVIAKAGARINPMKAVPFNRVLIIFNPMDSRQLSLAKNAYVDSLAMSKKPILMVTQLEDGKGWGSFSKLKTFFGTWNLFIVQDSIIDRFNLVTSPVIIQEHPSLKYKLLISEYECITTLCEI